VWEVKWDEAKCQARTGDRLYLMPLGDEIGVCDIWTSGGNSKAVILGEKSKKWLYKRGIFAIICAVEGLFRPLHSFLACEKE
jgi:hypothetical protein